MYEEEDEYCLKVQNKDILFEGLLEEYTIEKAEKKSEWFSWEGRNLKSGDIILSSKEDNPNSIIMDILTGLCSERHHLG